MDDEDKARIKALQDKLNRQLDKSGNCWLWTGFVDYNGYGRIYYDTYPGDSFRGLVHRLMWIFKFGNIPANMVITHKCGNKLCCNPKHLVLTHRKDISFNGRKTHCVHGHKLPAPKMVSGKLVRVCPECNKIRQAEYRKQKSAVLPIEK